MHQAWNKEKEVCQIMQRSGVHESCSKRRSLHEAWSKGQTMQQCGMNNSNSSSSSKRRSVHKTWSEGQTMQQSGMYEWSQEGRGNAKGMGQRRRNNNAVRKEHKSIRPQRSVREAWGLGVVETYASVKDAQAKISKEACA